MMPGMMQGMFRPQGGFNIFGSGMMDPNPMAMSNQGPGMEGNPMQSIMQRFFNKQPGMPGNVQENQSGNPSNGMMMRPNTNIFSGGFGSGMQPSQDQIMPYQGQGNLNIFDRPPSGSFGNDASMRSRMGYNMGSGSSNQNQGPTNTPVPSFTKSSKGRSVSGGY